MRAVEQFGYGAAKDVMRWVDIPIPQPAANEVLIKADFVGIRWGDIMGRTGDPEPRHGDKAFTLIAGAEVAGVIQALGAEVTSLRVGQRVFGAPRTGGYAEYAVV